MDITLLISAIILLVCFLALSWFAGTDAPYVPTKNPKLVQVLKLAGVKKGVNFFELGSGDGRVVLQAAKLGANSYGIEQSWLRVFYSKYQAIKLASHFRCGNTKFYHGNIFNKSYKDANIVYIYLLPKGVKKLEEKLQKELKKGSVVITQTYHFPTWKPTQKIGEFQIYQI